MFPEQKPIDRTFINTWEDARVVDAVKKTGRKKLIMAALWTEICLAMPAIQAAGEGYEVYAVTDASGGVTREAHDMAVQRMIMAGVIADHLDGGDGRVAARLGAREDGGGRGRNPVAVLAAAPASRSPGNCSCSARRPAPAPEQRQRGVAAGRGGRPSQPRTKDHDHVTDYSTAAPCFWQPQHFLLPPRRPGRSRPCRPPKPTRPWCAA